MDKQHDTMIQTKALVKHYPNDVVALNKVDLEIKKGEIYSLLGPNGAGKTTLLSILTTLLKPTSGTAQVAGFDVLKESGNVRSHVGITFQEMALDEELTGYQVLNYHGRLYKMNPKKRKNKIDELLALVELDTVAGRRCSTYSGGMKRRLELIRGLLSSPSVLFLDEPTLGLDTQNRAGIWEYIQQLRKEENLTVFLTTHYMDEAQQLSDRVGIIDHGELIVEDTPNALIRELGSDTIHLRGEGDRAVFVSRIKTLPYIQSIDEGEDVLQIGVDQGNRRLSELIQLANEASYLIHEVNVSQPNLGDVYLKHTGRQFRDI